MSPERIVRLIAYVGCLATGLGGLAWYVLKVPPAEVSEAMIIALVALATTPLGVGALGALRPPTGTVSSSDSPGSGGPSSSSSSPEAAPVGGGDQ